MSSSQELWNSSSWGLEGRSYKKVFKNIGRYKEKNSQGEERSVEIVCFVDMNNNENWASVLFGFVGRPPEVWWSREADMAVGKWASRAEL